VNHNFEIRCAKKKKKLLVLFIRKQDTGMSFSRESTVYHVSSVNAREEEPIVDRWFDSMRYLQYSGSSHAVSHSRTDSQQRSGQD
jgi:hypothetical protein